MSERSDISIELDILAVPDILTEPEVNGALKTQACVYGDEDDDVFMNDEDLNVFDNVSDEHILNAIDLLGLEVQAGLGLVALSDVAHREYSQMVFDHSIYPNQYIGGSHGFTNIRK